MEGNRVRGVFVETKSGRLAVKAKIVIDATGEADVAVRAGVNWEGSETLFQPEANIKLGTLHLFEQLLKFGDLKKALLSYNLGETRLRRMIRQQQQLPAEYLNKVLRNYKMLKETYKV